MAFGFLKKIFSFGKKEVIEVPQEGGPPVEVASPLLELAAPEPAPEIEIESPVEELAAARFEEPAVEVIAVAEPEATVAVPPEPKAPSAPKPQPKPAKPKTPRAKKRG